MTDFDYPTWAAQGRANADKLPDGVAEALGPERDWADELADAIWPHSAGPRNISVPVIANIIRKSRCRPIGNDTVTDELIAALNQVRADELQVIDGHERNGPQFTNPFTGNEYYTASYVLEAAQERIALIDAALAKATQ